MPDVLELLEATARQTTEGPDLAAISQRATLLRRQERVLKGAALLIAVLVAVPVLRWGGNGTEGLEQLPASTPPPVTASPSPGALPAPGIVGAGPGGASTGPRQVGSGAATAGTGSPAPAGAQPSAPTAPPSVRAGYPRAASCAVSSSDLVAGQSRSCQFRATTAGGADLRANPAKPGVFVGDGWQATLTVDRGGRIARYDLKAARDFCFTGVIRPGDLVRVTVRQESVGYLDITATAGGGHGC